MARATELVTGALRAGRKILFAGNGGSAADAQHLATELVVRFVVNRTALPAIALTTDTSILTAIGNDLGFEQVFARQIAALGREGDVFVAISTSGRSANIVAACREARERKLSVIGLTGADGGAMGGLCDVLVRVPSDKTAFDPASPHRGRSHHLRCRRGRGRGQAGMSGAASAGLPSATRTCLNGRLPGRPHGMPLGG